MSQLVSALIAASAAFGLGPTTKIETPKMLARPPVMDEHHRYLKEGPIFLSPAAKVQISTPYGKVTLGKGDMVFVVVSKQSFSVFNLIAGKSMLLELDKRNFSIKSGHCAIFSTSIQKTFEDVNPVQFVRYRSVIETPLTDDSELYQAEFSVINLVKGLPSVAELLHQNGMDSKLTDRTAKREAKSTEPFKFYFSPEIKKYMQRPKKQPETLPKP